MSVRDIQNKQPTKYCLGTSGNSHVSREMTDNSLKWNVRITWPKRDTTQLCPTWYTNQNMIIGDDSLLTHIEIDTIKTTHKIK